MRIRTSEYLEFLNKEYFESFIKDGGSTNKFLICTGEYEVAEVADKLESSAKKANYIVAKIDSSSIRIHMIDKIYYAIANQINWDELTDRFLQKFFTDDLKINIPPGCALSDIQQIAEYNSIDSKELFNDFKRTVEANLYKDYAMCKEFRVAMTRLARSAFDPENITPSLADEVKNWLLGEKCNFAQLKSVQIFQKIHRSNARFMISALSRWLKKIGYSGLIVIIDCRRVLDQPPKPRPEGELYYGSKPMILDVYESMRQAIDETDEMENLGFVYLFDSRFLTDDKKGLTAYDALKLRIWDEVHDRSKINPYASLIRLGKNGDNNA